VWVARGYEGEPTIVVLEDPRAIAQDAASRIAVAVERAVRDRGVAHISLTGGSSAVALYHALGDSPWREVIPWMQVHLWWGDERFVPLDHPESCANLAFSVLLRTDARSGQSGYGTSGVDVIAGTDPGVPVPVEHVHPIPMSEAIDGDLELDWVAEQYAAEVRSLVPLDEDGTPVFDVVLLGLGSDGHILSVFPDSPALAPDAPLAMAIPAPTHIKPHLRRVTLSPKIVPAARLVLVMIPGDAKAQILAEVLGGEREVHRWPAEIARCQNAVWLADRAAASRLPKPEGVAG
jgi:6-phosphogluconolactonase